MSNIYLVTTQSDELFQTAHELENQGHCCLWAQGDSNAVLAQISEFSPDIVIVDTNFPDAQAITKKIKTDFKELNIQTILLLDGATELDYLDFADGYVEMSERNKNEVFDSRTNETKEHSSYVLGNKNILIHTIHSHIKIKNSLDELDKSNKEISKNLYQLNVVYNTSSGFAGTLNREHLYGIMLEGLEKTLSFDVAALLVFNKDNSASVHINSLRQPTDSLKEALVLRLLLEYKNMYSKNELPYTINPKEVELIENVKPSDKIFDLGIFNFDKISAPIRSGEDFYGIIEIYRTNPFKSEDLTCFQTIVSQAHLPLGSAKLYEEIIEKNVRLERLERMKSEFVSIVSHELRTPLTPINNSLDIILSGAAGDISPDTKNFIDMAKRNVTRLSTIIEDLLDLSRIQTGKLDFRYRETNVLPSLEHVKQTFAQSAMDKRIELVLNAPEAPVELPQIYSDPQRLEQILSNLISNAVKFTPEGGKIELSAGVADAKEIDTEKLILPATKFVGKYVKICAKDTGVGIEPDDVIKIFDKFSQIENSLSRNSGGVGLGLSITKQLIDAHFGGIMVESEKNKGSNFCFFLPVLSEPVKFQLDVNKVALSGESFGLIYIRERVGCGFVEYLQENNILKLTSKSRMLTIDEENLSHSWFFTPEIEQNAVNFIEKSVLSEVSQNPHRWEKCDILLRKVDVKKDLGAGPWEIKY